jgi:hypothetical protein
MRQEGGYGRLMMDAHAWNLSVRRTFANDSAVECLSVEHLLTFCRRLFMNFDNAMKKG